MWQSGRGLEKAAYGPVGNVLARMEMLSDVTQLFTRRGEPLAKIFRTRSERFSWALKERFIKGLIIKWRYFTLRL
jgi:hypothetical protein